LYSRKNKFNWSLSFAQWIQASQGKTAYGFDLLLSQLSSAAYSASQSLWLPGWLAINSNTNSLFLTIGPGDFLVHHDCFRFTYNNINPCKGALDARGSKLMPDKKILVIVSHVTDLGVVEHVTSQRGMLSI
jgi:photosystem I P700 chlorophyll a apoprotein A2